MTEQHPSVTADDGSHWRLINNEWVGWSDGEDGSWTESEAGMQQYFPEVVQRWNDLTKEQP
jgi:hypothetical protein